MANLKDILEILDLKKARLEKDVAELVRLQKTITDKISQLDADKRRMASNLNLGTLLDANINDNVVFERWCHGMAQKKNILARQKVDIDSAVQLMKTKLKTNFVQEDMISTHLRLQETIDEDRRVETQSSTQLELWVNIS